MSRRRTSYAPHVSPAPDAYLRALYGEQRQRDPADLTIVPPAEDFDPWLAALRGLVLAVGGFAFCVTTWCLVLPLIVGGR